MGAYVFAHRKVALQLLSLCAVWREVVAINALAYFGDGISG
jgi:hypothetical protein